MTHIPLLDLYGPALERLRVSLGESAPPSEVAKALARALATVPPGGSPPSGAPAAAPFAEAVQSAVCLALYAVLDPEPVPDRSPTGAADETDSGGVVAKVLNLLVPQAPKETAVPPAPAPAQVAVAKVLDGVRGALEAADQVAVAMTPRQPEPETLPWTEDDELIDMLHDVLAAGARGREGFALARITDLEETLHSRGIQAVRYDAAGTGSEGDPGLFDFVEGARPGEPGMTLVPALVDLTEDGRTLRRGRVRPPAPARTTKDGAPSAHTD
ncbi:hypothetical protein [Streptomyces lushanensis]|uniref:hypothetical protein n=1 Tax=Streptomyces lushanensis TaxID=1434255 RepID=UPI00082C6158|nr:hypothetical protein [Streptomyces lushanensis]